MALTTEEQIPDEFVAMRCVAEYSHGIKVIQSFDKDNRTYFSVTQEPDEVTSPDDIEVKHVFEVSTGETGMSVKEDAKEKARSIEEMNSSIQETEDGAT